MSAEELVQTAVSRLVATACVRYESEMLLELVTRIIRETLAEETEECATIVDATCSECQVAKGAARRIRARGAK